MPDGQAFIKQAEQLLQNAEFGASTVLKVQELNGVMQLTGEFGLMNSKFIDFKVAVTEQTVLVVFDGPGHRHLSSHPGCD